MYVLSIGKTDIEYTVRPSARATRKRIVVRPGSVEVVVPEGTALDGPGGVTEFVCEKRRWIFDAVREIEAKHTKLLDQQYASGAKLQYRGRWLMLDVKVAAVTRVEITCRNKFEVRVPENLEENQKLEAIRVGLEAWLQDRAQRDITRLGRQHEARLGVRAKGYRLSDAHERWGSCGADGTVRVHWRLIQAPAAALEYVVAHEVAHLVHRHHEPEFWATLARALPDWAERKGMLERWEADHRAV